MRQKIQARKTAAAAEICDGKKTCTKIVKLIFSKSPVTVCNHFN